MLRMADSEKIFRFTIPRCRGHHRRPYPADNEVCDSWFDCPALFRSSIALRERWDYRPVRRCLRDAIFFLGGSSGVLRSAEDTFSGTQDAAQWKARGILSHRALRFLFSVFRGFRPEKTIRLGLLGKYCRRIWPVMGIQLFSIEQSRRVGESLLCLWFGRQSGNDVRRMKWSPLNNSGHHNRWSASGCSRKLGLQHPSRSSSTRLIELVGSAQPSVEAIYLPLSAC